MLMKKMFMTYAGQKLALLMNKQVTQFVMTIICSLSDSKYLEYK